MHNYTTIECCNIQYDVLFCLVQMYKRSWRRSGFVFADVCRPMVVIAGGYDQDQGGMGGFQEWSQVGEE